MNNRILYFSYSPPSVNFIGGQKDKMSALDRVVTMAMYQPSAALYNSTYTHYLKLPARLDAYTSVIVCIPVLVHSSFRASSYIGVQYGRHDMSWRTVFQDKFGFYIVDTDLITERILSTYLNIYRNGVQHVSTEDNN